MANWGAMEFEEVVQYMKDVANIGDAFASDANVLDDMVRRKLVNAVRWIENNFNLEYMYGRTAVNTSNGYNYVAMSLKWKRITDVWYAEPTSTTGPSSSIFKRYNRLKFIDRAKVPEAWMRATIGQFPDQDVLPIYYTRSGVKPGTSYFNPTSWSDSSGVQDMQQGNVDITYQGPEKLYTEPRKAGVVFETFPQYPHSGSQLEVWGFRYTVFNIDQDEDRYHWLFDTQLEFLEALVLRSMAGVMRKAEWLQIYSPLIQEYIATLRTLEVDDDFIDRSGGEGMSMEYAGDHEDSGYDPNGVYPAYKLPSNQ